MVVTSRVRDTYWALSSLALDSLPFLAALTLPLAWWLSLILVVESPVLDLTPPKIAVIAMVLLVVSSLPRLRVPRSDVVLLGLVAAYIGWFIVTSAVHGSVADVKMTLAYALYLGGSAAGAYVAGRHAPKRFSRVLVATILVVLALTTLGVAIERLTYPGAGRPDPLAAAWQVFRPQTPVIDPVRGVLTPPPLHFPSGDPAVPRASAMFAHVNYLAFFSVLAAALATALLLSHRRRVIAAAVLALSACSVCVVWTYSRVGLIGLGLTVGAVVLVDALAGRARGAFKVRRAWALPVIVVLLSSGVTIAVDQVGLRRFTSAVVPSSPTLTPGEQQAAIEASASRSTAVRLALQGAAVELITRSPKSLLVGPGQHAFEAAIHTKTSPLYIAEAAPFRDSNSLWLTLAVAGGIPGALLMAAVLAIVTVRLLAATAAARPGVPRVTLMFLAAWVPAWAVTQIFGTFPFVASEAIILGILLGSAIALGSADLPGPDRSETHSDRPGVP